MNPLSVALVLGGASGLLGQALVRALRQAGHKVLAPSRHELNLTDTHALGSYLKKNRPTVLFNTVAYTAVDQAEDEPQAAMLLNAKLPALLGQLCAEHSIIFVQYSTDFVFNGQHNSPYTEEHSPCSNSVYGQTKLEGENALLDLEYEDLLILRTAWLFGPDKTNFVHKILGVAQQRSEITVVADQIGSPSYAPDVAKHSMELVQHKARGVFHVVNSGQASWFELATQAVKERNIQCQVRPVATSAYPTKATRPKYSVLDTSKLTQFTGTSPRPWQEALHQYLAL